MKKMKEYIINNKFYLLIMCTGFIAFAIQMSKVVLYADDFVLGGISKSGLAGIWEYFKMHYTTWGGGYTALVATICLMFNLSVWKISHCFIVFIIIWLSVNMITNKKKENKTLVAAVLWILFFLVSIFVSRETIYWFDGALAYTFSAFQLFIYFYFLYSRMEMGIKKKYDIVALPIVAFFAGWSTAQTGPIAVLITILFFAWQKLIKKEKLTKMRKVYWVSFLLCIVGLGIFLASPGNNARMVETFPEYANYNIFQKIVSRCDGVYGLIFDFITYPHTGVPFYLMLEIGLTSIITISILSKEIDIKKKKSNIIKFACVVQIIFLCICAYVSFKQVGAEKLYVLTLKFNPLYEVFNNNKYIELIPYMISSMVMLCNIICVWFIGSRKKNPILILVMIIAYTSQGIMVMAPYSPIRTTFYMILFLWIAIAYLFMLSLNDKIRVGIISILVIAMYNSKMGVVAGLALLLLPYLNNRYKIKSVLKYEMIIVLIALGLIAARNYSKIVIEYGYNQKVYNENIRRIQEYKSSGVKNGKVKIVLPKDENYGFTPLVGIDWVEVGIKSYFEIEDAELVPETYEEYLLEGTEKTKDNGADLQEDAR